MSRMAISPRHVAAGDIVITADIPLAALVIAQGAVALDPRGETHTADTIGDRLAMRNLMEELRWAGAVSGGPAAYSASTGGTSPRRSTGWSHSACAARNRSAKPGCPLGQDTRRGKKRPEGEGVSSSPLPAWEKVGGALGGEGK